MFQLFRVKTEKLEVRLIAIGKNSNRIKNIVKQLMRLLKFF